ncbi:MAG: ATP synthase subunit I [Steroidobacteraceae bacterium]
MLNSAMRQALRILGWQLAGLVLLAAGAAWFYHGQAVRSVLVGSGIGLVATGYLVFVLVKHSLQPTRPATVLSLFGNWFIKTGLVVALLVVALRSTALTPPAVLIGLVCSLAIYWLTVLLGGRNLGQERD